jgi:hypothetical protein
MQFEEKGMENLLMNIMLKKYLKKTQIQKTPLHAFLLGIFGWNFVGQNTMKSYGYPP